MHIVTKFGNRSSYDFRDKAVHTDRNGYMESLVGIDQEYNICGLGDVSCCLLHTYWADSKL